jgi:hypothetical protein
VGFGSSFGSTEASGRCIEDTAKHSAEEKGSRLETDGV